MARSTLTVPLLLALSLCAGLAGCAGTKVLPGVAGRSSEQARIKGDAKFGPFGNAVVQLEQVDGRALGATQSQALVPPGHHTVGVRCSVPSRSALVQRQYAFDAEAGHTYRLQLVLLSHPPGCAVRVLDTDTNLVVAGPGSGG